MQNKKNLRRLVQWLAIAAAAVWLEEKGTSLILASRVIDNQ